MPVNVKNIVYERSYGSTATTLTEYIELGEPILQLNVTMHFLQNGSTLPTIANVLTQMATQIRVKQDGVPVFAASPADLRALDILSYQLCGLGHISNGTGADNAVMFITLAIPFSTHIYPFGLDPKVALPVPKVNTVLELDVPADASTLDTRRLTVSAITLPGASPIAYIERVVKNVTPSGTGWGTYVSLPYGSPYSLYDVLFWQTTNLGDGTTSDVTTIEQVALELNEVPQYLHQNGIESLQFGLGNFSASASSPAVQDEYAYFTFAPNRKIEDAIPLDRPARIAINAGDTNAIRVIPGLVHKV
ncbi:Double jelly roll major capsid protein [Huginn virus]|nr:Double jelly roll major capsid protein [Huginn virus]